jgi:RNA polymerase sigma factor (sigma-70 family)
MICVPCSDKDPEEKILRDYFDYIKKIAWRYAGRGAEVEDLEQEASMGLITLARKCPPNEKLSNYIRKRLPGQVRDAAHRYRYPDLHCELTEAHKEAIPAPKKHIPIDFIDLLERNFSESDLFIIWALSWGCTQKEIAEKLNKTQQSIHYRLTKIRKHLQDLLRRYWDME